ncbi:rubredoxin [Nocardia brasiliensis]|uniref:Rubredoxin n=1 Tax=Nocardia brasiliensis TaxID=37326 RepID=A0A6G9XXC6_NOCBR|nr:rubredoxin [Nocardia brasiliensis]QIS05595.1 rubredoxin [Nocardia brasiliensis]
MGRSEQTATKAWMCLVCGWVYYETLGVPSEGIAPGTRWEDIPDEWRCPDCGAAKEDFVMTEL